MCRIFGKRLGTILPVAFLLLSLGAVAFAAPAEYWLSAGRSDLTMPDATVVPVFGYAQCTASFATCGPVMVPGPQMEADEGDTLTIHVQNNLMPMEPTSLIIHGQQIVMNPTMFGGKVFSFTDEASAGGGAVTYVYTGLKEGTFLYESGSHTQVQVPMGLYGVLIVRPVGFDPAAPDAYGNAFDNEEVIVFSDLDPGLNNAVVDGSYGSSVYPSTARYRPRYFMLNGVSYPETADILTGGVGEVTLLRFLNGGSQTYAPTLGGLTLTTWAEDGNPVVPSRPTLGPSLPAGKTMDVVVNPSVPGQYPLYDASNHQNASGDGGGGMLTFFDVPGYAVPPLSLTLAASLPSPQPTGAGVTFTATLVGPLGGPFDYQFKHKGPNDAQGLVVQGYGPSASWAWTPAEVGEHWIGVLVRAAGASGNPDVWRWIKFNITPQSATGVTLVGNPAGPQGLGVPVVFTATGQGPAGASYEYQFRHRGPNDGSAVTVQPLSGYSTSDTWSWTTVDVGVHWVGVLVRTVGSTGGPQAQRWIKFTVVPPAATGVDLVASPTSPQGLGVPVTFTATGQGSSGETFEYQFLHKGPNDVKGQPVQPSSGQGYETTDTWVWTTVEVGEHWVGVFVRTVGSVGGPQAQRWIKFTVVPPPATGVSLAATPGNAQFVGLPVGFVAAGEGPAGVAYEYRFFHKAPSDATRQQVQPLSGWGALATWNWTAAEVGKHAVRVQVRTVGSAGGSQAETWMWYDVVP